MAYHKIGVSASEMMALRNEGYSNKDIANLLEISRHTVRRYIGNQTSRRMDNMAAFEKPATKPAGPVEIPEIKRAVDEIVVQQETVGSANGNFTADVDYIGHTVLLTLDGLRFDELPEFATFIIGITERIKALDSAKEENV